MSTWNPSVLDRAGLNLQAVFDLDRLPTEIEADIRARFDPNRIYRQLILIGHGGTTLWSMVKAAGIDSEDPIDDFSTRTVEAWLAEQHSGGCHAIVYPGEGAIGLQTLGRLAGWHHDTPLRVGINARWGTWYAYRVVVLADSDFEPTRPESGNSPCEDCRDRACVAACPAGALTDGALRLEKCVGYRKQPESRCKVTCLARLACPVGAKHRYCEAQIRHSYVRSMQMIEKYF